MRRALAIAALAVALVVPATAAHASGTASGKPPKLHADAAILVDQRSGEVLYAKNPDERNEIASTTKLMTADLALEHTQPTQVLTSPGYSGASAESVIGLRKGERMTVHDLLRALLLESANDAAYTIAVRLGGSEGEFVDQMNAQASALGLGSTHYENPIGLDDAANYSTARDLAKLASRLMGDPRFAGIVSLPSAALTSGSHERIVHNRNLLVGRYRFVNGVKTGHTSKAGYCLVGSATAKGAHVVSVVLHDPSESARDDDTLALLQYGLAQYRRVRPLAHGAVIARPKIKYRGDDRVSLTVPRSVRLTIKKGEHVSKRVLAPGTVDGPIPAGRRVGSVALVYRGKVVRRAPLVTAEAVPAASFPRKVVATIGVPLTAIAFLVLVAASLGALRMRALRAAGEGRLKQR
jgi:D-alanyl-D-alanine carboxypeptidase (penicillin-binding protein 5/6)